MIIPETFRKYLNPREYMYWNRMYEMQQMKKRTSNIIRSHNDKTIDLIYVALVLEKKFKKPLPYPCVQSTLALQRNQNLKQHLLLVIFPHVKKSWKEQEAHHVNKFVQIRVLIKQIFAWPFFSPSVVFTRCSFYLPVVTCICLPVV